MLKKVTMSMKLTFKYAGIYAVIKLFLMLITALAVPVSIYVMQKMIESMEKIRSSSFSLSEMVLWIGAFAAVHVWELVQEHIHNVLQLILLRKLKVSLLPAMADKAGRIPYENFEASKTKDIFHRLEKAPHETVLSIFDGTLNVLKDIISIAGIAFIFARVSCWFLLIFLAVLIPALWFDYRSSFTVDQMHEEQTFAERELAYYDGLLSDKYTLHELSMTNSVEYVQDVWEEKAGQVLKEYIKATLKSQLILLGSTQFIFVFTAFVIGIISYSLYWGTLTISVFVTLVGSIQSVDSLSYSLGWSITSLSRRANQMKYFEAFFALPEEARGARELEETEFEIVFDHVGFAYPGTEKQVLADLSFRIKPGEQVCIVGRNGAGKSTIIKLLCGLYKPDRGEIKINGITIGELSGEQMKRVRSVVFQDYFKFYSTIRENVAYSDLSKLKNDQAILEALKNGQAAEFVEALSGKLDSHLGNMEDDGVDLSGGQWQKLAIARACLCGSKFIILDEPTAALDPVAESRMYHTFAKVLKDYGYIFISHRLASAKMADRILVIEEGQIAEDGDHRTLMEKKGIYFRMFTEQSSWYTHNTEGMVEV